MDASTRKQKAHQAITQLTISLSMRMAVTGGTMLAALVAAVSAFAEFPRLDRAASVAVLILLVVEAVIYGFAHTDEITKQRAGYSRLIHEIEAGKHTADESLLQMPESSPLIEGIAFHINQLRWREKPRALLADLLVCAVILSAMVVGAIFIIGCGVLFEWLLINFELVHHG
jgi:hypothetical protein